MTLYLIVKWLLHLVAIGIAVRAVLSWFAQGTALYNWFATLTEPFLMPFRGISNKLAKRLDLPVDISSVLAIVGIELIDWILKILHNIGR